MAILSEEEVIKRVESPMNLFHRLRTVTTPGKKETLIVSIPPKSDDIIPNLDEKLAGSGVKAKAMSILSKTLSRLDNDIETIDSRRLPSIARDMVSAIKVMEPEEAKKDAVQFIIYQPQVMQEADYGEVIEAAD